MAVGGLVVNANVVVAFTAMDVAVDVVVVGCGCHHLADVSCAEIVCVIITVVAAAAVCFYGLLLLSSLSLMVVYSRSSGEDSACANVDVYYPLQ